MDYKDLNDKEILSYIYENDEVSKEIIFEKYDPLIKTLANKMSITCKNVGVDINDLIQEGMIGLNQAINTYKDNKDTSFYTYAKTCIERRMISLIVSTKRLKHKHLNEAIAIDVSEGDESNPFEFLLKDDKNNPEDLLIQEEKKEKLLKKINDELTDYEYRVFSMKVDGFNYKEIAEVLDVSPKAVDNALQRIKKKVQKIVDRN